MGEAISGTRKPYYAPWFTSSTLAYGFRNPGRREKRLAAWGRERDATPREGIFGMNKISYDIKANASSPEFVTINVEEILRFFDEKPEWAIGHVAGVVGVVGEDLNVSCFQRYIESSGAKVTVRADPVTTGRRKGPRLDRWIVVEWPDGRRTVFQTEIKSWSAHAFGGRMLPVRATPEEVAEYKRPRWQMMWDSTRRTLTFKEVAKVLVPMKPPADLEGEEILPLLIFWEALGSPDQAGRHLFKTEGPTGGFPFTPPPTWPDAGKFPALWVFSVSSYLRSIRDTDIELRMPNAARRIEIIGKLFSTA